jgi:hypothetical protein
MYYMFMMVWNLGKETKETEPHQQNGPDKKDTN